MSAVPVNASHRWLFGPLPDVMLGCGGLYILLFAASAFVGESFRSIQPFILAPLLLSVLSAPHYGATLVRVYERSKDRNAYFYFAVHSTILVWGVFAVSMYHWVIASWFVTLFLTWSPWHYTGQNYGLAMMFLRRAEVVVTPRAKSLFHASFVLSFALIFLVMHGAEPTLEAAAASTIRPDSIGFRSLGIPASFMAFAFPIVGLANVVVLALAIYELRRNATFRELAPAILLSVSQTIWFTLPLAVRQLGWQSGIEPLDHEYRVNYFLWIGIAHALQYIWVTTYFARGAQKWSGYRWYWTKIFIAGQAIWTVPVLLFGPHLFGSMAYNHGLYLVVAAAVNVHHFVLDGAIWKLRSSRVAKILIRPNRENVIEKRALSMVQRGSWAALGTASVLAAWIFWANSIDMPNLMANERYAEAERRLDQLHWVGMDSPQNRLVLGRNYRKDGNHESAHGQYQLSASLNESITAYSELAYNHAEQGEWQAVEAALQGGLKLDPSRLGMLHRYGVAWLELGKPEQALPIFVRALAVDPTYQPSLDAYAHTQKLVQLGRLTEAHIGPR
jgi:tetratricopeptide (TPR) repeat protein